MKLRIDGKELELDESVTLYHAAKEVGVDIPVMCYREGYDFFTSCMICVVKDKTSGAVLPACSALAADGMDIETQSEEIQGKRKSTLDLLLSEHLGDCEAPCRRGCGVDLEIPRMIREIMSDDMQEAIATVRRDVAVPAILERLCHAPCETPCRRTLHDKPLSIRQLARTAADWDLQRDEPHLPDRRPETGKTVAVVGAGLTGLSAAHYLAVLGDSPTVFECKDLVGGRMRTEFDASLLPEWVVEGELGVLKRLGVEFSMGKELGKDLQLADLREDFDAVLLTFGATDLAEIEELGLAVGKKGPKVNAKTGMTSEDGVFATGSLTAPNSKLIKTAAAAKKVATVVHQYLLGEPLVGIISEYDHSMGRLFEGELEIFVSGADPIPRLEPEGVEEKGFSLDEAKVEAGRCMHCDCREKDRCKLRIYSDEYGASQKQYKPEERARHSHVNQNAGAVYEAGKCIKCGLCVRVTQAGGEDFGFTFVGRGFDLRTGISLDKTLRQGLQTVAHEVVEACPTGALSANEKYDASEDEGPLVEGAGGGANGKAPEPDSHRPEDLIR